VATLAEPPAASFNALNVKGERRWERSTPLAHVGIYADDKPLLERFYTKIPGLVVADSGQARSGMEVTFMSGGAGNHHRLVLVNGRPETSGFNPINQISFMVDSLARPAKGAPTCTGQRCDGDAGLIARQCLVLFQGFRRQYCGGLSGHAVPRGATAWRHGEPLDLSKSDAEILRETEATCRADPGFMTMDAFQASLASRLAGHAEV
jgi:catechol 2,3-dioxygenase